MNSSATFKNKYVVIDSVNCSITYRKNKLTLSLEELRKMYIKMVKYNYIFGGLMRNKYYQLCIQINNKQIKFKLEECDRRYFIEAISAYRKLR